MVNSRPSDTTFVFDQKVKGLKVAVAFGTSMRPFLEPGVEITSESAAAETLCPGDIITFKSSSGALVTHRIVKKKKAGGRISFLTKGDNRMDCDPPVFDDQVTGRVIRVAEVNIRSLKWRLLGWAAAFFSYGQYVLYIALAKSFLNQWRHQLEKKTGRSHFSLAPWFAKAANPVRWAAMLAVHKKRFGAKKQLFELRARGITVQSGEAPEIAEMTRIWNEAFPACRTGAERLERLFCGSRWFHPKGYFTVRQGAVLIGWAYVRENFRKKGMGCIEAVVLTEAACQPDLEQAFFLELLEWFWKRRVWQISLNTHPVPADTVGIQMTSLMKISAGYGFEPMEVMMELRCGSEEYRKPEKGTLPEGLSIQPWRETDSRAIYDFLIRNNIADPQHYYEKEMNARDVWVAKIENKITGFCRCISPENMKDYSQTTWIWVLSDSGRRRGYFLRLLTDKAFEGRGIGTALTARALESCFASGCEEISLMISQKDPRTEHFYQRFGFKRAVYYFWSRWTDKN